MNSHKIGQFVTVGRDMGVVIGLPSDPNVPEEHLAIWYGQTEEKDGTIVPRVRTVPEEYCIPVSEILYYH